MSFGFSTALTKTNTAAAASLMLDMLNGQPLDNRITFTNASTTSCPTYFGSDGRLATMGVNYITYSNDTSQAAWVVAGTATKTGTNQINFPTGTGDKVQISTAPGTSSVGTDWTAQVMLSGSGQVKLFFFDDGGAFPGTTSATITLNSTPTQYTIQRTHADAVATKMAFQVYAATAATVIIGKVQVEKSTTANTYVQTTSTAPISGPRSDYDPSTPLDSGARGPELMILPVTTGSWAYIQPTAGSVSVTNGVTRVNSTDGTLAQFQENNTLSPTPTAGRVYALSFTLAVTTGTCLVQDIATNILGTFAASGNYTVFFTSTGNSPNFLFKRLSGVTDFSVSNISVKAVIPATTGVELAAAANYGVVGGYTNTISNVTDSSFTSTVGTGSARVYLNINVTAGKTYRLTYNVAASSFLAVYTRDGSNGGGTLTSANNVALGAVVTTFVPGITGTVSVLWDDTLNVPFSVSGVSVQEVVFTPKGQLIEEARTNLLLNSRDQTQASWTLSTNATRTRNQVGLDGVANTATKVTDASAFVGGKAQSGVSSFTVSASTTYSFSIAVKAAEYSYAEIQVVDAVTPANFNKFPVINLTNGTVGQANGTTLGTDLFITPLGGGWYRVSIIAALGASTTSLQIALGGRPTASNNNYNGVVGSGVVFDCAGLEVGAWASSIIVTGASTVTRSADVESMTGTNYTSWWNATQGTFVVEAMVMSTASAGGAKNLVANGTGATPQWLNVQANAALGSYSDGGVNLSPSGTVTAMVPFKGATAYSASGRSISLNGSAVATDAGTLTTGVTAVYLGSVAGTQFLNGWLRRVTFYPVRVSDSRLPVLTT